ncbi:MAG TPA: hypothetical protein VD767_07860 [Thermomicrobiales bacterium]|nr:hypothetical protein [Thermomicrobiales bacterium]
MPLGAFGILSLFYVVIGIRVIYRMAKSWDEVWDTRFTQTDRAIVDEAAFFILIPVSVALHELGHAMAIWLMGGEVVDFGFYGFAGWVSYYPGEFSDVQQTLISAAGSFVNLLLCLIAFAVVFFKRPPKRAAINELLLQFAFLSGINAFVVYPLLDLASGMNGDWRQMYSSGVPWLTAVIVAVQIGVLWLGYWLSTNTGTRATMASRTAVPAGFERGTFGGIRPATIDPTTLSPVEQTLQDASDRVASGWLHPVKSTMQRFDGGTAIILEWSNGSPDRHAVAARSFPNGRTEIVHLMPVRQGDVAPPPRLIHQWPILPSSDQLTMGLRLAMETVDRSPAR